MRKFVVLRNLVSVELPTGRKNKLLLRISTATILHGFNISNELEGIVDPL